MHCSNCGKSCSPLFSGIVVKGFTNTRISMYVHIYIWVYLSWQLNANKRLPSLSGKSGRSGRDKSMEKHLYQMPANCHTSHRYTSMNPGRAQDSLQGQWMWTDARKGRLRPHKGIGITLKQEVDECLSFYLWGTFKCVQHTTKYLDNKILYMITIWRIPLKSIY